VEGKKKARDEQRGKRKIEIERKDKERGKRG
jgi:hypothetical protein